MLRNLFEQLTRERRARRRKRHRPSRRADFHRGLCRGLQFEALEDRNLLAIAPLGVTASVYPCSMTEQLTSLREVSATQHRQAFPRPLKTSARVRGHADLYTVEPGHPPRRFTDHSGDEVAPSWSPPTASLPPWGTKHGTPFRCYFGRRRGRLLAPHG